MADKEITVDLSDFGCIVIYRLFKGDAYYSVVVRIRFYVKSRFSYSGLILILKETHV